MMNSNFCEECGNKLSPGDEFCDQCGTKVNDVEEVSTEEDKRNSNLTFGFFQERRVSAGREEDFYYGILLTNFKKLKQRFGRDHTKTLKEELANYLDHLKKYGVYYLVLDASDNILKTVDGDDWKRHVSLLRKGIKRISKKLNENTHFVMLLGGNEIIPMPVFPNPNDSTSDTDVDSDLPYSTLSVKDPMESEEARTPLVAVGRIPTGVNSSVRDLLTLFRNTQSALEYFSTDKTFGLSANCWQEVSNLINSRVCKESLYISPGLTIENLHQHYRPENNIHYFNLHGSDSSSEWFGQQGSSYPAAFAPAAISRSDSLNVIGVEACYGARFINLKKEDSILLSALAAKTVSFAGSSRIAFGPSSPPMNLADIVIHDFLSLIQQNRPAGNAFLEARTHAFQNSVERDPTTSLLTLMEFNLFGDPVFFIPEQGKKSAAAKRIESKHSGVDGDAIDDLPDEELEETAKSPQGNSIYNMVTQAVDAAQKRITDLINKNVWQKYPEFKGIEPAFVKYSWQGKSYNKLTYRKELEKFARYLMVNTDPNGNIIAEFDSK